MAIHRSRRAGCVLAITFTLIALQGCGDSSKLLSVLPVAPESADVALGKRVQFDAPSLRGSVTWMVASEPGSGVISRHGVYYAPIRMPANPLVEIRASSLTSRGRAAVLLHDTPPDSLDCYADGQPNLARFPDSVVVPDELPTAILKVAPVYPDLAREAGVDGLVIVRALVCACGEVSEVRIRKSIPMLDGAALRAVSQWIFDPALIGGEPVATWVEIPVRFSLH